MDEPGRSRDSGSHYDISFIYHRPSSSATPDTDTDTDTSAHHGDIHVQPPPLCAGSHEEIQKGTGELDDRTA